MEYDAYSSSDSSRSSDSRPSQSTARGVRDLLQITAARTPVLMVPLYKSVDMRQTYPLNHVYSLRSIRRKLQTQTNVDGHAVDKPSTVHSPHGLDAIGVGKGGTEFEARVVSRMRDIKDKLHNKLSTRRTSMNARGIFDDGTNLLRVMSQYRVELRSRLQLKYIKRDVKQQIMREQQAASAGHEAHHQHPVNELEAKLNAILQESVEALGCGARGAPTPQAAPDSFASKWTNMRASLVQSSPQDNDFDHDLAEFHQAMAALEVSDAQALAPLQRPGAPHRVSPPQRRNLKHSGALSSASSSPAMATLVSPERKASPLPPQGSDGRSPRVEGHGLCTSVEVPASVPPSDLLPHAKQPRQVATSALVQRHGRTARTKSNSKPRTQQRTGSASPGDAGRKAEDGRRKETGGVRVGVAGGQRMASGLDTALVLPKFAFSLVDASHQQNQTLSATQLDEAVTLEPPVAGGRVTADEAKRLVNGLYLQNEQRLKKADRKRNVQAGRAWKESKLQDEEDGREAQAKSNLQNASSNPAHAVGEVAVPERIHERLEKVWETLDMPMMARVDMTCKYTTKDYAPLLEQAVAAWEDASRWVLRREEALEQLMAFDKAMMQSRMVAAKLAEEMETKEEEENESERLQLVSNVSVITARCLPTLDRLSRQFNDTLVYKGRVYVDKIKRDNQHIIRTHPASFHSNNDNAATSPRQGERSTLMSMRSSFLRSPSPGVSAVALALPA